ncbi:hypothetical protein R3P38DRAFT_3195386 [Favolaschia claudopus]|uniref:Uncharacterized protein n=1 Tax=Favolaschia claudopus TaxID=2862362 RepID=A0AAW0BC81_9AGAR
MSSKSHLLMCAGVSNSCQHATEAPSVLRGLVARDGDIEAATNPISRDTSLSNCRPAMDTLGGCSGICSSISYALSPTVIIGIFVVSVLSPSGIDVDSRCRHSFVYQHCDSEMLDDRVYDPYIPSANEDSHVWYFLRMRAIHASVIFLAAAIAGFGSLSRDNDSDASAYNSQCLLQVLHVLSRASSTSFAWDLLPVPQVK